MNYTETIDYLYKQLPSFEKDGKSAYKPGLERVAEFCRKIGNPQRNYFIIHIAGTNGKGSVANMIASVMQQAGYRTGLYTSPHLVDFRERIRVDGEVISKQKIVNFVNKHRLEMEGCELSFFEMATVLAFDYFSQSDVEVAVIETGLGGRLDATNVVIPALTILTNVGLEHTDLLGDSLPKIAREKCGIIKKSIPIVVGEYNTNYNLVVEEVAADANSPVIYAEQAFSCLGRTVVDTPSGSVQVFDLLRERDHQQYTLQVGLLGEYQRQNVITVCAAIDYLHQNTPLSISRRALVVGLRDVTEITGFEGRWQQLSQQPKILCDTAHNSHAMELVARQIAAVECEGRRVMMLGFCSDKDIREMLAMLPRDAHYIFTQAESHRAASVEFLQSIAAELGLQCEAYVDIAAAFERSKELVADNGFLYIGGSTYIVGAVKQLLQEAV